MSSAAGCFRYTAPSASVLSAQAVPVYFRSQDVYTEAAPGTNIVQVAHECGVTIATGCSSGSCGICEVEVYKYDEHNANPSPALVRACIAAIPRGYTRLEIDEVSDPIWGGDGWDT
ncbi:hypothetical protein WJX72_011233 [[Myrmecia] bisecta]|uniref:2Fe-2S ferredoxin-type domain-containing protein n=1 Tax=[Myrmecia] bisecta TaxID=41462 RepID=A0AAW1Q209_9CHLO